MDYELLERKIPSDKRLQEKSERSLGKHEPMTRGLSYRLPLRGDLFEFHGRARWWWPFISEPGVATKPIVFEDSSFFFMLFISLVV